MALGSTQPLTEMSTSLFPWGKGGRCLRLTTLPPSCAVVMKSGNLNLLEPSGPLQARNGTALPLTDDVCNLAYSLYTALKVPTILQSTFRELALFLPLKWRFGNVALFFVSLQNVVNETEIFLSIQDSFSLCTNMSLRIPHISTSTPITVQADIGLFSSRSLSACMILNCTSVHKDSATALITSSPPLLFTNIPPLIWSQNSPPLLFTNPPPLLCSKIFRHCCSQPSHHCFSQPFRHCCSQTFRHCSVHKHSATAVTTIPPLLFTNIPPLLFTTIPPLLSSQIFRHCSVHNHSATAVTIPPLLFTNIATTVSKQSATAVTTIPPLLFPNNPPLLQIFRHRCSNHSATHNNLPPFTTHSATAVHNHSATHNTSPHTHSNAQ